MRFGSSDLQTTEAMHHPRRHRRKAWRREKPSGSGIAPPWANSLRSQKNPAEGLSKREITWLATLAVLAIGLFLAIAHFTSKWHTKRDVDHYVERLRNNYNLNDRQVVAIREIEFKFHGNGGIFFSPSRSHEEKQSHQIEISQQMSPEAGLRFLADLNRKGPTIQKQKHAH